MRSAMTIRAMVLVYEPQLTHSVWQDFVSRHRTERGLERRLRKGVKKSEWIAWRIIEIRQEVFGNDSFRSRKKS
jgi:hypothetical protein